MVDELDLNEGTRRRNLRHISGNGTPLYSGTGNLRTVSNPGVPTSPQGWIEALGGRIGGWCIENGKLTADGGNVKLNSYVPSISLGSATDFDTGTGIWQGRHGGVYKWRVGNPAAKYISWDNATLQVVGDIESTSGHIGGWALGETSLTSGTGANTVGLDSGGTNPAIYAGSATPASAPFRVTKAGLVTAVSGTIGGCTLAESSISAGYVAGVSGWSIGSDGSAEFENAKIRGALQTVVFQKGIESAFAGSMFCGKSAGVIATAFVIDNTAVPFANTAHLIVNAPPAGGWVFDTGDIVHIKAQYASGVGDTWLTLTRTATTNDYTVTVNNGTVNLTYPVGTAVKDYGPNGGGFFGVSADGGYGATAAWILGTHGGQPWLGVGVANGITQQVYAGTDGILYAGAGAVTLDVNGVTFSPGTSRPNGLTWGDATWSYVNITGDYQPTGTQNLLFMRAGQTDAAGTRFRLAYTADPSSRTIQAYIDNSLQLTIDNATTTIAGGLNGGTATGAGTGFGFFSGGLYVGAVTGTTAGEIAATSDIRIYKDGSDTLGSGPHFYLANAANNRAWALQLSASNHLDFWNFNGTAWAKAATLALTTGRLGVGVAPSEIIHSSAKVRADTVFNCNNTDGVTGTFTPIVDLQSAQNPEPPNEHWVQVKTQIITVTGGIVTNIGAASDWTTKYSY